MEGSKKTSGIGEKVVKLKVWCFWGYEMWRDCRENGEKFGMEDFEKALRRRN